MTRIDFKSGLRRLAPVLSLAVIISLGYAIEDLVLKSPEPAAAKGLIIPSPPVLGVAGANSRETTFIVPPDLRAAPYHWDLVPSNDTSIQVLRSCDYYATVLGEPPVSAYRWWCWDQTQQTLISFSGATAFEDVVRSHPDWIWMIANEPDHIDQDGLSPEAYAEFFGAVATRVANALRIDNPAAIPKLVFCQVSSTDRKSYCEQAYFTLKQFIEEGHWPDWPADLRASDVIHAVSVHNYLPTDPTCAPGGPACFGSTLEEGQLEQTMTAWSAGMDDFAAWADSMDGGILADKPLWLTEFGALWAFCPGALEFRAGIDSAGGVPCPDTAIRGNGTIADDYVFYGRNEREGIWGAQRLALNYLLNPGGNPNANRGEWAAAWWFGGRMDWLEGKECKATVWLLGDDTDCTRSYRRLSHAGQTFRNIIGCLAYGRLCS